MHLSKMTIVLSNIYLRNDSFGVKQQSIIHQYNTQPFTYMHLTIWYLSTQVTSRCACYPYEVLHQSIISKHDDDYTQFEYTKR